MQDKEKRRYKRAYIRLPAEYRGKSVWQHIEALNLSAVGMFVVTKKIEPPQSKVDIMFEFGKDDKRFIHAEGVVVWSRAEPRDDGKGNVLPPGMGIEFTKFFPSSSKDFINDVINKMESEKNG